MYIDAEKIITLRWKWSNFKDIQKNTTSEPYRYSVQKNNRRDAKYAER